jgi:hypothetical protein
MVTAKPVNSIIDDRGNYYSNYHNGNYTSVNNLNKIIFENKK